MKNKLFLTGKILSTVFSILLAILLAATPVLTDNQAQISSALGAKDQVVVEDESDEVPDTQYFKTDFNSVAELKANERRLAQQISAEGSVLVKNDNGALPLAKGKKIGLYSISSVSHLTSGGGSSQGSTADTVTLKTAFIEEGFALNEDLYNWYSANQNTYGRTAVSGSYAGKTYDIEDAPWDKLPEAKNAQTDLAIFVLSRMAGESTDVFMVRAQTGEGTGAPMDEKYVANNSDVKNGNYLELNDNELSVLAGLKAQKDAGKIGKIMVLMNFANQVELDFIDKVEYGIDAALWVGTTGSVGARAIADIVSGDVNPSGGLMDTFWTEHHYNPVYANWTDSWFGYQFVGKPAGLTTIYSDEKVYNHTGSNEPTLPYVVYEEGVYNGYKYTETRYEDVVMKTQNVGSFDYSAAVKYPFGFGLSYSTFTKEVVGTPAYDAQTDTYTVKVKVTNTGTVAGKDTVEIYVQKPYTAYDKAMGVEKPAVELVGYGKTNVLAAGVSETLEIKVDRYYFATYDSYGARGYIIEEGDYYLIAASDAHEAVNNVLAYKGYTTTDGMTANGNADMVMAIDLKTLDNANGDGVDAQSYKFSKVTGKQVTNQFDNADPLYYMADETRTDVKYLTRNDWTGTVEFGLTPEHKQINDTHAVLYWSDQVAADLKEDNAKPTVDDVAYPTMGSTKTSYTLVNLMGVEKDDQMWQDLLDQMSWDDMVRLLTDGERKTQAVSSIAKPQTIDHNGAIGVNQGFAANAGVNRGYAAQINDPNRYQTPIVYPCNGVVAATFNDQLVYEYGQQWGEDALWAGYSGLYGPGANGHRSAYAGRNFEYYSEDGILGGEICAQLCKGIVEHGILIYLKHAILNDQENNRLQVSTFANEQTIRETYLRPFELAIVKGGAQNVMSGYNRIGAKYTGIHGFCNTVLREEMGMTGFVVTDYLTGGHENRMPANVLNGNDIPDRNWWTSRAIFDQYDGSNGNYGEFAWAMRQACHNVLYGVANSAAMNGLSNNTRIITFTPSWVYVFESIISCVWWIFGASVVLCGLAYAYETLKKKNILCSVSSDDDGNSTSGGSSASGDKEYKSGVKAKGEQTPKKKTLLDWVYMGTAVAVAGVMVIGQASTLITMAGKIGANNDIIALEKQPEAAKEINPEDIVTEGVTEYKFEAETAHYEGVTGWSGEFNEKYTAQCYVISEHFSGNILLWNINQGNANKSNKLTFKFTSDKAETIIMKVKVTGLATEARFSSHATIRVNGELYNCDETIAPSNSKSFAAVPYGTHSDFPLTLDGVWIPIEIKEGENEISFATKLRGANTMFGFDCITLCTTANIEYQPEGFWPIHADFDNNNANKPGPNSTGKIRLWHIKENGEGDYYSWYAIPSLTDGVNSGLYKFVDNTQDKKFEYYFFNQTLKVAEVNKGPFTLTFDSPYITVNGGGNSVSLTTTYPLDNSKITINAPAGRKVVGWYNKSNPTQYWMGETFKMPEGNMTIAPVFDGETYMYESAETPDQTVANLRSGKVNQTAGVWSGTTPIRNSTCSGSFAGKDATIRNNLSNTILVDGDGYAETALNYSFGAVTAGSTFGTMTPCVWAVGGSRTVSCVYKNTGSTTLDFDMFIYTSGGSASSMMSSIKSGSRHNVVLAPGEVKKITFTVGSGHNNMMTGYLFNTDISSMSFACYQYVDASQNLTLSGATFKDGSTVKKLDPNTTLSLSDVTVNLGASQVIAYWYNTANPSQRWKADLSDFATTGSPMTIAPKIESPATQHTLTLSGAKFADNSTTKTLNSGDGLPAGVVADTINGKTQVGWADATTGQFYALDKFEMPRKDTTLAPVYDWTDDNKFIDTTAYPANTGAETFQATARFGKVALYNGRAVSTKNYVGISSIDPKLSGAIKMADNTFEKCSLMYVKGGVSANSAVTIFAQQQNWMVAQGRQANFRFHNQGTEAITFEVMLSNSSGSPTTSKLGTITVTIAAGEIKDVVMPLTSSKDSIILHWIFASNTTTDLKLAYNFEIAPKQ